MSNELENARKKAITSIAIKLVLCLAAGVLGVLITKGEGSAVFCILGFLILAAVAWAVIGRFAKNRAYALFITLYKRDMIQAALNGSPIYDNVEFKPDCGFRAELVKSTGLLPAGSFFSNCHLSGTYNGVPFCQAEVRSVRAGRDGGSLEYDGTLISFPTALPEAKQTNIYDRQADIAVILPGSTVGSGNAEFDAAFEISTSSAGDFKNLITSDFMSALMSIRRRISRKIVLTVSGGRMFVFLTGKQSVLRPNLFKKCDEAMQSAAAAELNTAGLLIDAFGSPENDRNM